MVSTATKGKSEENNAKADLLKIIPNCIRGAASKGDFYINKNTVEYYFVKESQTYTYERRVIILCQVKRDQDIWLKKIEDELFKKCYYLKKEIPIKSGTYKTDLVLTGPANKGNDMLIVLVQCKVNKNRK